MPHVEKNRYAIIGALAMLTVAAFLGLKGSPPLPDSSPGLGDTVPAVDETTAGNCGRCTSQNGMQVDCYKPTQRYTCASKATACASYCQ